MSPAKQFLNTVLGKKTHFSNQLGHTILHTDVKQPGIFAISAPVVTADDSCERLRYMMQIYLMVNWLCRFSGKMPQSVKAHTTELV